MKATSAAPLPAKHLRSSVDLVEHADWKQTFDALDLAVVVCGANGEVRRSNQAASDLLRLPPQRVAGRALRDVARAEPWLAACPLVDHVIANRVSLEVTAREPSSERCWALSASP